MQSTRQEIELGSRRIEYRLASSRSGTRLRVQVGPAGVRVLQPAGRQAAEVEAFIHDHEEWILGQIERVEALKAARRERISSSGEILFRGEVTQVQVLASDSFRGPARVSLSGGRISIRRSPLSPTPPHASLERWLRREAKAAIRRHLQAILPRVKRAPGRVYVMGQKTKWGNCSALGNLSFNWRLVLAPDFVLQYLVTHEAVHLAVPDHSPRFWLTVRSLCPHTERARRWLCDNADRIWVELEQISLRPDQ
jgi:predicted metal-dependent hydrolase